MVTSSSQCAALSTTAKSRRIEPTEHAAVFAAAIQAGVFGPDDDAVMFYDLDRLRDRISELRNAFPAHTLHALAVKANPAVALLRVAAEAGMGAEVASRGELALAEAAGLDPALVVFDSPAKTEREIRAALQRPLLLNANSRPELLRIAALDRSPQARVGLRVNPMVGVGTISQTSTATARSKFGVPIGDARAVVAEYGAQGGRLDALHVHVGSQAMTLDQLVRACKSVYELFIELSQTISTLTTIDIGGGLPVSYRTGQVAPSHADYAASLRSQIPGLWSADLSLITEFGRSIHANNGWVASRVEYVLDHGSQTNYSGASQTSSPAVRAENPLPASSFQETKTLITHVGADLFVRTAYQPEAWPHEVLALTPDGQPRSANTAPFDVAGPLCFAGDYIAQNVQLPADVTPGDFLIMRDTGAYTAGMWSIYNSRQMPKTIGYSAETGFISLTNRESLDSIVSRWNT